MIYKPEHVSDLESGAIVQAEVLEGDHADTKALSERVACAVEVVNRIAVNEEDGVVRSLTADKGYFVIEEIAQIQEFDIRTVIGDANAARRRKEAYPLPAGQYADYLKLQLQLFQKGHRGGSAYAHLMHPVATRLTPEQIRDVALYLESVRPDTAAAR